MSWRGMGLAIRAEGSWYQVEPSTARDFMAYLAGVISARSDQELVPVTDQTRPLSGFGSVTSDEVFARTRAVILKRILPTPDPTTTAYELRRFKEHNSQALTIFRRRVEDEVSQLLLIEDDDVRNRRRDRVIANLREEIQEVTAHLRRSRIDMSDLFALSSLVTGVVGNALAGDRAGYAAGVFGFLAFATRQRDRRADSPLAFAALSLTLRG